MTPPLTTQHLWTELERARQWVSRLSALLTVVLERQTDLESYSVDRHLAVAAGDRRAQFRCETRLARAAEAFDVALATALTWTDRDDYASAYELVTDVRVRLALVWEAYEVWRRAGAQVEAIEALGGFETPDDAAAADQRLRQLETEVWTQAQLVLGRLPDSAEVD